MSKPTQSMVLSALLIASAATLASLAPASAQEATSTTASAKRAPGVRITVACSQTASCTAYQTDDADTRIWSATSNDIDPGTVTLIDPANAWWMSQIGPVILQLDGETRDRFRRIEPFGNND